MRFFALVSAFLLCVTNIWSFDIGLDDINWVIAEPYEGQSQACLRVNLRPLDISNANIAWNESVLEYVVTNKLNATIKTDSINGLYGCCAPSLWCDGTECFTQGFGEAYVNYGWNYFNLPNAYPVFTCYNHSQHTIVTTNALKITAVNISDSQLILSGHGFTSDMSVQVNGMTCLYNEVTPTMKCSTHTDCPLGYGCILYKYDNDKKQSSVCLMLCAATGDMACPQEAGCYGVDDVWGELVYACLPSSYLLDDVYNQEDQLLCQGNNTLLINNVTMTSIEVSIVSSDSQYATYALPASNHLTKCKHDSDCFDGDVCTLDTCESEVCIYTATSDNCGSVASVYQQSVTPYRYYTFSTNTLTYYDETLLHTLLTSGKTMSVDINHPNTFDSEDLKFDLMYFGNYVNTLSVNGNGLVALQNIQNQCYENENIPCQALFSTTNNLLSAYFYNYSTLDVMQYSTSNAFHLYTSGKVCKGGEECTVNAMVSLYSDHSIRMTYYNTSTIQPHYRGLWGSFVSSDSDFFARYHMENLTILDTNIKTVSLCYENVTLCIPSSCAIAGSNLTVNINTINSCQALTIGTDTTLDYVCDFGGIATTIGVVEKVAESGQAAGSLLCPVPELGDAYNDTLLSVSITLQPSDTSIQSINSENKVFYGLQVSSNNEFTTQSLLVRYYANASQSPQSCGCNALDTSDTSLTCDKANVCNGHNHDAFFDCYKTPFGSAIDTYCSGCSMGYTLMDAEYSCSTKTEDVTSLVVQTVILLLIICCLTFIISVVSYSIRRMMVSRIPEHMNDDFGLEFVDARGNAQRTNCLSDFEIDCLGEVVATPELIKQLKQKAHAKTESKAEGGQHNQSNESLNGAVCECSICLMDIVEGAVCRVLPEPCGHYFHRDCIDQWFKQSTVCPLCKRSIRRIIEGESDDSTLASPPSTSRSDRMMSPDDYAGFELRYVPSSRRFDLVPRQPSGYGSQQPQPVMIISNGSGQGGRMNMYLIPSNGGMMMQTDDYQPVPPPPRVQGRPSEPSNNSDSRRSNPGSNRGSGGNSGRQSRYEI